MDAESDDLTTDNIVALRGGGDTAVLEARKAIAAALTRAPHAGVERVRNAIDEVGTEELKDPEARTILGQLAALVDRLAVADASDEVCWQAVAAAKAVRVNGGAAFAREVIKRITYKLDNSAPIFVVLRGMLVSLSIVVVVGLVAFTLFTLGAYFYDSNPGTSFFNAVWNAWKAMQSNLVVVAGIFGLLGAIVSVLLGLAQFDLVRRSEQFLLVSGGVLPIVGAIFAMVACAFFESGLISTTAITEHEPSKIFFYIVLGFVAGFSERFVRGLLVAFETRYQNGGDADAGNGGGEGQPPAGAAPSAPAK